jgi:4a-hydroxytetrahydrobiopterin dehydratase
MALLNDSEIHSNLDSMDGWVFSNNSICKEFLFNDYMNGIQFVNELAKIAEKNNHHPDIIIGWCKVTISFTSHDLGGVSTECMNMAKTVENFLKS